MLSFKDVNSPLRIVIATIAYLAWALTAQLIPESYLQQVDGAADVTMKSHNYALLLFGKRFMV